MNAVQDAGGTRTGQAGEVFRCTHCRTGCDYCGGTGFRSVCNKTVCHEYGCSHGTCVATRQEFEAWERRRSGSKEVGHE